MSNQSKGSATAAINAAAEATEAPKAAEATAATPAAAPVAEPSLMEKVGALAKACIKPAIVGVAVAGAYTVGVRKGVAQERARVAQAATIAAAEAEAAEVVVV